MNLTNLSERLLGKLPARFSDAVFGGARKIPRVRRMLDAEYEEMLADAPLDPPAGDHPSYDHLPGDAIDRGEIIRIIGELAESERSDWSEGRASGAVYHGNDEHIDFLNQVYSMQSQSNPLHLDLWPSGMKFESEIVAMTAAMLGADATDDEIVGTVTSGGTESIIMAMKADRSR